MKREKADRRTQEASVPVAKQRAGLESSTNLALLHGNGVAAGGEREAAVSSIEKEAHPKKRNNHHVIFFSHRSRR